MNSVVCPAVQIEMGEATPVATSWVNIAVAGEFRGHPAGEFALNREIYEQLIRNFRRDPNGRVPVDFDHLGEVLEGSVAQKGAPAPAWVTDLRIDGDRLYAKWEWVDPETVARVRAGQFRWVSPAITFGAVDQVTGEEIGPRLSSVAITNRPFLPGLEPLTARAPAAVVLAAEHAPGSAVLQTVIVSKDVAKSAAEAKAIAAKYGTAGAVDETSTSYRYRQRDPGDFVDGSFRTIEPGDKRAGVKLVVGHLKAKHASLPTGAIHVARGVGDGEAMEPEKDEKKAEARRMEAEAEMRTMRAEAEAEYAKGNPFVKKMRKLFEMGDDASPDDLAEKVEEFIKEHKQLKAQMAKRMEAEAEMRVAARVDAGVIADTDKARARAKAVCLRDPAEFDELFPEPAKGAVRARATRPDGGPSAAEKALLSASVMPRNDGARSQQTFAPGADAGDYDRALDDLTMELFSAERAKSPQSDPHDVLMRASSEAKKQLASTTLARMAR